MDHWDYVRCWKMAAELQNQIFELRHDGKLGSTDEDVDPAALEPLIEAQLKVEFEELLDPSLVTSIARDFPQVELLPDDDAYLQARQELERGFIAQHILRAIYKDRLERSVDDEPWKRSGPDS